MSQPKSMTTSIENYRELASEMLRRANADKTPNMRCLHLMLAMEWKELADCTELVLPNNGVTG